MACAAGCALGSLTGPVYQSCSVQCLEILIVLNGNSSDS